ncbi:MAG: hypothetical protein ABIO34_07990 [Arthrobacter oryzae]
MAKYVRGPGGSAINAEHIVRFFVAQGGVRACAGLRDPNDAAHYLIAETVNGDICDLACFDDPMNAEEAIEDLISAISNPEGGAMIGLFPIALHFTDVSRHDIRLEQEIAGRNDAETDALGNVAMTIAGAIIGAKAAVNCEGSLL